MPKIKILYIVSTLERKGPTNQLFYLIKYLDTSQYEVMVLTLSKEPGNSMIRQFTSNGIAVLSLNFGRVKGIFYNRRAIDKVVKNYNPDIIQAMGLRSDGYLTEYTDKAKCITTSRNFPVIDYPKKYGKIKGTLMARQHLEYFRKLSVVSCSRAISNQLISVGVESHVIQNGIDLDLFKPASNKAQKRAKMSLPSSSRIFVVVGSLIERKNVKLIIDAFSVVDKEDILLIVIGDGPEIGNLKNAAGNKNIRFVGDIPNVIDYLQSSDVMISASLAEGLPNAVLEGLACGLSVILSAIEPHKEIIEGSAFEQGLFHTQEQLSNMINQYASLDFQLIDPTEGPLLIREKFSAEKMSKNYQEFYIQNL
ncbi:glycosyltransferase family 4 protein [Algoriphagus sp. Y33]|uniref:glycosyltransferase family 4 protein n=1 Tax=Algoriphagus sp. Y33 TaxID=2772483 RepID=UPI00177C470E|nr:glycosyltransferase family 4 protein [Algoriphagus sp. Y33]